MSRVPHRCHVLGHGFGGMLAVQALAEGRLEGLASLSLLSVAPSWTGLVAEQTRQVTHSSSTLEIINPLA